MHRRQNTPRIRVAIAERRQSVLPYLLFALFLLFLSSQASAQGYGKDGEVHFERKRWAQDELPSTLSKPVRDVVADWGPWAKENGFKLILDETQQVFLVVETRARTAPKHLRVIDDALEVIEELSLAKTFTPTPISASPARLQSPDVGDDVGERWGRAAGYDPDRIPVIALVQDEAAVNSVLQYWMAKRPDLEWEAQAHKRLVTFISEEPLFAVIATKSSSQDEWSLEHDIAAFLTRMMLKRTHGPLPKWIEAGLTWQVETRLFHSIWHFFERESQHISSASHSGWERELRTHVRRFTGGAGLFEKAAEFDPKEWNDREAYLAWGIMCFLTEELDGRLPQCLGRLSKLRDEGARVDNPDGSWEYDISFLPSRSDQFCVFADLLGDEFEEGVLKAFKRGLKRSGETR